MPDQQRRHHCWPATSCQHQSEVILQQETGQGPQSPNPIDELNGAVTKYAHEVIPGIERMKDEGRAPYEEVLDSCGSYYIFMNYVFDLGLLNGSHIAIQILYAKAAAALSGVHELLRDGNISEAVVALRDLFETDIATQVMFDQSLPLSVSDRCQLFVDYEAVQKWYAYQDKKSLTDPQTKAHTAAEFPPDRVKQINDDYARVRASFGSRLSDGWSWKIFSTSLPRGQSPSLKYRCKVLGRLDDYLLLYGASSISAHAQPLVHNTFRGTGGRLQMGPTYPEVLPAIAAVAVSLGDHVVRRAVDYLKPADADRLKEYSLWMVKEIADAATRSESNGTSLVTP